MGNNGSYAAQSADSSGDIGLCEDAKFTTQDGKLALPAKRWLIALMTSILLLASMAAYVASAKTRCFVSV